MEFLPLLKVTLVVHRRRKEELEYSLAFVWNFGANSGAKPCVYARPACTMRLPAPLPGSMLAQVYFHLFCVSKRNPLMRKSSPVVLPALVLLLSAIACSPLLLAQSANSAAAEPAGLAAAQAADESTLRAAALADHQQMMDQLHIKTLRPAASHDPASPNFENYNESKANPYPGLPDPLQFNNGSPVLTPADWWQTRRPQIVALFDHEVLGSVPARAPSVRWQVLSSVRLTLGGVAVEQLHVAGTINNSDYPTLAPIIDLLVGIPAQTRGRVPVVLSLAFANEFNALLHPDQPPPTAGQSPASGPGTGDEGPSWQQQVVGRGWAYAVLLPTSFQADNGAGLRSGVIGLVNHGQPRSPVDWGTLRAWAWGASRAADFLSSQPAIDPQRMALEGHSRFGKTALVAMAYDARFRAGFISSAGTGGSKLYRHAMGELLENLTAAPTFYYWMAGNFLKYGGPLTPGDLPVDAHELIALCAPRPVLISVGSSTAGDKWADPVGEWRAAVAAGPVYRLLGQRDLETTQMPAIDTGLLEGAIAFRQHRFGHTPGPNWPVFLDYAARAFAARQP